MNKETIKLLFMDDSLPVGGRELLLLTQLKHLDRSRFEVHLAVQTDRGALVGAAAKLADHHICLERKRSIDPMAILRLRRYLITHEIDIVHSNSWLSSLYLLIASWGLSPSRIAAIHGYEEGFRMRVNFFTMDKFETVLCVSRSQILDLYKNGVPLEKMTLVYNCFDEERFPHATSRAHAPNPFKIVTVGNIREIKGCRTLIKAAKILEKEQRNVLIFLVGGDLGDMDHCKRLVRENGLGNRILFTGPRKIDSQFLSEFDLFVSPSLVETFGIAVLEAMAVKLPVLVSDIPSSMEIILHGRAGFYFEARNPASCAENIAYLMDNPGHRFKKAEMGFIRSRDFLASRTIKALEDLYTVIYNEKNQLHRPGGMSHRRKGTA